MASVFNERYGEGAAEAVLGGGLVDPKRKAKEEAPGRRSELTGVGKIWNETVGAVAYGVQEGINETVDTFESFDDWYGMRMEEMGIPGYLHLFDNDGTFNPGLRHRSEIIEAGESSTFFGDPEVKDDGWELNVKDRPPETILGSVLAGGSQFITGYASLGRVMKMGGLAGSFVKGAIADATVFDPDA